MPPKFNYDYTTMVKSDGEPLTDGTKRIYRAALNKLAKAGYDTPKALLDNQKAVLDVINTLAKDDGKKRLFLSAIFKTVQHAELAEKQAFYDAFQKVRSAPASYEFLD